MLNKEIQEFAENLVKQVRDTAIRSCDGQMKPNINTPIAKRWRGIIENGTVQELQKAMITDCIDEALFFLLQSIDQGVLNLSYNSSDGKSVNLTEEGLGELSGWYMGSEGWRSEYSGERFTDDFLDLA